MDKSMLLAEQHIRESQSRLLHVDELMARANRARAQGPAARDVETLLRKTQLDRDRYAREIEELQRLRTSRPAEAARRGAGLEAALELVGLEFEKALVAVLDIGR